jgi:hypothetical protein
VKRLVLLVILAAALTGCLGGGPTSAPGRTQGPVHPAGQLQIAVRLLPGGCGLGAFSKDCTATAPRLRRYALSCGPAGGTAPNPPAACRAIADYLGRRGQVGGCAGVLLGPGSTATISGTFAHRPFRLRLTAGYSWCGQPRPLLRDFWVLSTFPCSNLVLRTGGRNFARWARDTGCAIDA